MEPWTWLLVAALAFAALCLALYIWSLRRDLRDLGEQVAERLETDTNASLSVSCPDSTLRALAARLNTELQALRRERLRLQNGDAELKAAITNISHDLRTPLTAISGYLDLLEQKELSADAARYVAVIRERTAALTALTDELLQYSVATSAAQELHPEEISLTGVLEESLAAYYAALTQSGIVPVISLPETPVVRTLDPVALRRVLGNVINNALKYSEGDLSVTLTEEGEIVFSNRAPGLDTVQAARLFDRFYTVETANGSTGLGLSIAKTLIERMGGTIRGEYKDGRLYITLRL